MEWRVWHDLSPPQACLYSSQGTFLFFTLYSSPFIYLLLFWKRLCYKWLVASCRCLILHSMENDYLMLLMEDLYPTLLLAAGVGNHCAYNRTFVFCRRGFWCEQISIRLDRQPPVQWNLFCVLSICLRSKTRTIYPLVRK